LGSRTGVDGDGRARSRCCATRTWNRRRSRSFRRPRRHTTWCSRARRPAGDARTRGAIFRHQLVSTCTCPGTVLYEHLMSDVSDRLLLQLKETLFGYVEMSITFFCRGLISFIRSPRRAVAIPLHVAPGAHTRVRHVVRHGTTPSGHRKALRLAIACRVLFGGAQGFGKGGSRAGG